MNFLHNGIFLNSHRVYFTSLEAFRKVLTPQRLNLLHLIREREPESLLARRAGRNIRNVSDDVKYLAQVGLVDLKDTANKISARVNYETSIVKPLRSVLHKTPDDYGMTGWQDIYFPSDDGTPLEGWYDLRNHGTSSAANGGICGIGRYALTRPPK